MPSPCARPMTATSRISDRSRSRPAFSLVELLIVVSIIGVTAAIALPKIRVERAQVDGAVRTVNMALMVAQREAVSRGHNVLVVFDTAHHVIRTVWDRNNNMALDAGEKTRPFPLPERVVLGRGAGVPGIGTSTAEVPVMLSLDNAPMLVLQRNGGADRAVMMYLTTVRSQRGMDGDKDTRALSVNRATGRPVWYVYAASGWKRT